LFLVPGDPKVATPKPSFTTIADIGTKTALLRRLWPKDAPLAI
jgi:hypothetical protein